MHDGRPSLDAAELPLRYPYPPRHHVLRERSAAVERVAAVRPDHPPHMAARKRRPHRGAIPELSGHLGRGREPVPATYLARRAVAAWVVVRQPRTAAVAPCFALSAAPEVAPASTRTVADTKSYSDSLTRHTG